MNSSSPDPRVEAIPITTPWPVLAVVTVLTGLAAGLSGMLLALLLHVVQHSAYSYGAVHSDESFLQGVMNSSPLRRLLACRTWLVGHPTFRQSARLDRERR